MSAPAPGDPSLRRVHVVVDPSGPDADLAELARAVGEHLPWDRLPAMTDSASRSAAVVVADDAGSVEVVLLVESTDEEQAEADAVAAVREALAGAGVGEDGASLSQVVVQDAYTF